MKDCKCMNSKLNLTVTGNVHWAESNQLKLGHCRLLLLPCPMFFLFTISFSKRGELRWHSRTDTVYFSQDCQKKPPTESKPECQTHTKKKKPMEKSKTHQRHKQFEAYMWPCRWQRGWDDAASKYRWVEKSKRQSHTFDLIQPCDCWAADREPIDRNMVNVSASAVCERKQWGFMMYYLWIFAGCSFSMTP